MGLLSFCLIVRCNQLAGNDSGGIDWLVEAAASDAAATAVLDDVASDAVLLLRMPCCGPLTGACRQRHEYELLTSSRAGFASA
jgi:hypothetical protein